MADLPRLLQSSKQRGAESQAATSSKQDPWAVDSSGKVFSATESGKVFSATAASLGTPAGSSKPLTVADFATRREALPSCSAGLGLADAARLLYSSGQTSAYVVEGSGETLGLLTEADLLHAYQLGAPADCPVRSWLRASRAKESEQAVAGTRVALPEQPLREAFARESELASTDFLAGHLVVPGIGVLTPMDLARAMARVDLAEEIAAEMLEDEMVATVAEAMAPIAEVPTLSPGSTMQQLLQALLETPAHAALVSDEGQGCPNLFLTTNK